MSKLGVGVLGVGRLGRRHAENLKHRIPDARLVAVADADHTAATQVAKDLEVEHTYATVDGLLERKDVQAIVIATPSKFHAEEIQAAAQAGKHVFCEKPIALTLEAADAALAAVRNARVQLQLGFMRRFDPAYASAKQRVDAGDIGDPVIFKSVGRDKQLPPPRFLEGGVNGTLFSDAAIHDFDLGRWMMNDEIVDVHAFAGILACPEMALYNDVDATMVNLRFGRGGIGNVEAFRKSSYGYDIRTEILGTKGALQVGYLHQTPVLFLSEAGITHDVVDHWLVRFADAYRNELDEFVGCILKDRPIRATGGDGRKALAVAIAAERSYHQGQVISIRASNATTVA
jgi:scyllo-inositol 2-dehydrogenase (NAD+)